MRERWGRLEAWHARHGAELALRPPATEEQIAEAERAMGVSFPAGFRESLRVHDGQVAGPEVVPWCPATCPLVSLARMVERYREERTLGGRPEDAPPLDLEDHFQLLLLHPLRIPIAGTPWFDGDLTYLDLTPGPAGAVGQVVTTTSECDFVLLDTSFEAFFDRYLRLLESGALTWDGQAVVPAGRPSRGHPADALARIPRGALWADGDAAPSASPATPASPDPAPPVVEPAPAAPPRAETGSASGRGRSFEHGEAAAGAGRIRPGFARTPEQDLWFALGFPYVSLLVDDPPEAAEQDVAARARDAVWGRYPVEVPVRVALARARALLAVTLQPDGTLRNPEVVHPLVERADPLTVEEAAATLRKGLVRPGVSGDWIDPALSATEALIGPSALAGILMAAVEDLSEAERSQLPKAGRFARWLGFSLLRVPAPEAAELRARLEAVAARLPAGAGLPGSVHRSIEVVLQRAERVTSSDAVHLVDAPPERIRQIVLGDGAHPRLAPDARLLFLGGTELIPFYVQHLKKFHAPRLPDLPAELGPIRAEEVLDLLLLLSSAAPAKEQTLAWFASRAAETRPFLERRLAEGGDAAKRAKAVLAKLPR